MIWPHWLALAKEFEGFRACPYRCPANVWTIGYGHTGPEVDGLTPTTTEAAAALVLEADMEEAQALALATSPILASCGLARRSAVGDFIFNIGLGNASRIGYLRSTFRKRVEAREWAKAASENAKWNRGGGQVLAGLTRRRAVTSTWLAKGAV